MDTDIDKIKGYIICLIKNQNYSLMYVVDFLNQEDFSKPEEKKTEKSTGTAQLYNIKKK